MMRAAIVAVLLGAAPAAGQVPVAAQAPTAAQEPAGAQEPAVAPASDVIGDIRVHGNHTTPDADILAISGLSRGESASDERLGEAGRRLRDSHRFAGVELRRRYASLDDPSNVLIMIVVDEHAAVSDDDLTPGPAAKMLSTGMWLPVINHADGYGFTYGARVSFVNVLGARSRLSVPLTWGGERRVALEAERRFAGPLPLLRGSLSLSRRVNPHYELSDLRQEARVEAERPLWPWLRIGAGARVAQVGFGSDYDARHRAAGAHAIVDTRVDPSFPRNAVHARTGWEQAWFGEAVVPGGRTPKTSAGRWLNDVRGYVGVGGSAVLALRAQLIRSDAALPLAEQPLLGGSDSVRGYRTGHRAGDNLAALSAEVRVPVNSPLSVGRFGVKAFVDAGTVWNQGQRLRDQPFDRGIGGGIYLGATAVMADIDVAWPKAGGPRVHFGLGVSF